MNEDDILQFNIIVLSETYYSDETTWGCFNFSTKEGTAQSIIKGN